METSALTQEIAKILRGRMAEENLTQAWLGSVIGRHQTTAGAMMKGRKAMNTDEFYAACKALGLVARDVVDRAERAAERATPIDEILSRDNVLSARQKAEIRAEVTQTDEPVTRMRHATGRDAV